MVPKCIDCFYCRRGCIVTYQPVYTCLHPLVRSMDSLAGLPEQCAIVRGEAGVCGKEGALFRPGSDDTLEQPPMYQYRQ
jgi:hypothetical protein